MGPQVDRHQLRDEGAVAGEALEREAKIFALGLGWDAAQVDHLGHPQGSLGSVGQKLLPAGQVQARRAEDRRTPWGSLPSDGRDGVAPERCQRARQLTVVDEEVPLAAAGRAAPRAFQGCPRRSQRGGDRGRVQTGGCGAGIAGVMEA